MNVYHINAIKSSTDARLPNFYRVEAETFQGAAELFARFLYPRLQTSFGSFSYEVHTKPFDGWCDAEVTIAGDIAPLYTFRLAESDRPLHIRGANKRLVPETCKYCKFGKSIAGSDGLYSCRVPLPVWLKGTDRTVEPVAGGSCGTFTRR